MEEAFLSQCAYDYFTRDRVTEGEVFQEIQAMYYRGEPVRKICRLAFLKYYAEMREERNEKVLGLAEQFLKEFLAEGIHLEFFREYGEIPQVLHDMADKAIIEYHSTPGARVCLHYVFSRQGDEAGEYTAEYMQEVFGSVFVKEFVLFFGETVQYYITEEKNGEEQLTESGTLQKSDIRSEETDSRYQMVNDIVISRNLQDYDTLENLLEEYRKKDFLNGQLFEIR